MTPHPISDHALLRYMERVQGIDVEQLKDSLLNKYPALRAALNSGATSFTVDDISFVMKGGAVTSVICGSTRHSRSTHLQREIDEQHSRDKSARKMQYRRNQD